MPDHSKYYYELNSISTISTELLDYCKSIEIWNRPGWTTFLQNVVPKHIYEKDTLVRTLCEQGWKQPIIFKSEPKSIYRFHTDRGNRPIALNMLLGEHDSETLFMGDLIYRNQYELIKVDYKPNRYYLLNTTEQHAVMNYGTDRYLLSISPPDRYLDPSWNAKSPELYTVTKESKKIFFRVVDEFKNQQF
jgi:hypothetical protein